MRKEKEIAETKSELLQSESVRCQQRLEYVEKQLKDTEEILEKEKLRTKSLPVDDAEHEEIMKKVARLAEVEEMNNVLNSEKQTLQNKLKQSEATVKFKVIFNSGFFDYWKQSSLKLYINNTII